jgi:hypothetical protein
MLRDEQTVPSGSRSLVSIKTRLPMPPADHWSQLALVRVGQGQLSFSSIYFRNGAPRRLRGSVASFEPVRWSRLRQLPGGRLADHGPPNERLGSRSAMSIFGSFNADGIVVLHLVL